MFVVAKAIDPIFYLQRHGVWVPALAGTTRILFVVSAESAMTPYTGGKAGRAGQRFARGNDLKPAAHFVGNRFFLSHIPLLQRRAPVCAQAGLREARDIPGERHRMR